MPSLGEESNFSPMRAPAYFDYCATTPLDDRVLSAMLPYFKEFYGNSMSALHSYGWEAESAVETARQQISQTIQAQSHEIFFTSGATESNNWVIRGLISHWRENSPKEPIHVLTTSVEHLSVLQSFRQQEDLTGGRPPVEVEFLPVDQEGRVQAEQFEKALKPHTKLISTMWVNNEIGSINPLQEIAALAKKHQIYLHTDATQAIGKVPVNVESVPVDLMSFSAHKIYGPKGIGALYVRSKNPPVQIKPLIYGGNQERGLRAGTINVPGVVGFGKAMELVKIQLHRDMEKAQLSREKYLDLWRQSGLRFEVNGSSQHQVPHILNITAIPLEPGSSFPLLRGIAYSQGSACHGKNRRQSHVLAAIGRTAQESQNTFRFSFGRFTQEEDWEKLTTVLLKTFLPF